MSLTVLPLCTSIHTCFLSSHASASYGNADILRWLLQNGGRVDIVDADGDTPLHACESAECAALLLSAGAVLDALNSKGLTPYHVAVMEYREEST